MIIKILSRCILTIIGFIAILFGSIFFIFTILDWQDYNSVFKYGWLFLGFLLIFVGSFVLVTNFKANIEPNTTSLFKKFIKFVVYFLILIQFSIFIYQIHELLRYDKEIAEYMPTLSSEGNEQIAEHFHQWAVGIPFVSQLVLLLALFFMISLIADFSLSGAYAFLISTWLTCFSWSASMCALVYAASTFD